MASKTLADRFLEQKANIYTQFSARAENSAQPFVTITPDTAQSRSRIKDDNRSVPFVSTQRDLQRIRSFINSPNGRLFIGKQLLLQTGNTFADTKIYNPASPLLNAVPFLHIKRHISTSAVITRIPGLLQVGTVNSFTPSPIPTTLSGFRDIRRNFGSTLRSLIRNGVGGITNILRDQTLESSRPEFIVFGPGNSTQYNPKLPISTTISGRASVNTAPVVSLNSLKSLAVKSAGNTLRKLFNRGAAGADAFAASNRESSYPTQKSFLEAVKQFKQKQYETAKTTDRFVSPYFNEKSGIRDDKENPTTVVSYDVNRNHMIGSNIAINDNLNIRDNLNKYDPMVSGYVPGAVDYSPLTNQATDIIKFIFSIKDTNIQFRAFISNFKENIKPEFNEQRYIGRTERYVTYSGAKRTASLQFNIVAFSEAELTAMWTRINYLTGLAFPTGIANNSGFMIPPLFKITVGGIYDNQPCYLDSLDFDFLDENITFDIDRQVSKVINVNMSIVLLEKRSRYYNSPFYEIMDKASPELEQNIKQRAQNYEEMQKRAIDNAIRRGTGYTDEAVKSLFQPRTPWIRG